MAKALAQQGKHVSPPNKTGLALIDTGASGRIFCRFARCSITARLVSLRYPCNFKLRRSSRRSFPKWSAPTARGSVNIASSFPAAVSWLTSLRSTSTAAVFSHTTPPHARFTSELRKYRSGYPPPALLFITHLNRHPSGLPALASKTATIQAYPHRNPIDSPASTASAAHFKRLYRNCPATATLTETSSRGSHDRVLTFYGIFACKPGFSWF
jgi:hypothetical protein